VSASGARRPDLGGPFGRPGPRTPDRMRIFTTEHIERARSGREDIYTVEDLNRAYQCGHDDGRSHTWMAGHERVRDTYRAHNSNDHSRCERRGDVCVDPLDERPM